MNTSLPVIIDGLINNGDLKTLDFNQLEDVVRKLPVQDNILHAEVATRLWNFTSRLSLGESDAAVLNVIAILRKQASLIVLKSGNSNLAVTMALKTALSWARCGNTGESYQILSNIEKIVPNERNLDVLSTKAQLSCLEGDLSGAEDLLHKIAEISQETAALTCWEIALNFYKQDEIKNTLHSVERAINYGKGILPNPKLSRMYRLLTTCYFDEGADVDCCTTSARRALDLDECTESHLLLVRCLAVADKAELLANELQLLEEKSESCLEEALHIVFEYCKPLTASRLLGSCRKATSSQTNLLLLKSQLHPQTCDKIPSRPTIFVDKIENITSTVLTLGNTTDKSSLNKVRDILWQSGVDMFEAAEYQRAVELYNLCLEHCDQPEQDKLLRNIATCQIANGEVDSAEQSLSQVKEECSQKSILLFQVALVRGDTDRAVELVGDITDEALLQTAAMSAFKANSEDLAAQTLHKALLSSNDQKFKLVALRCLLRLSKSPQQDLALYRMLEDVSELSAADLTYFTDSAWNSTLKAKPNYELMVELLEECMKMLARMSGPLSPTYVDRGRNCCLLVIAAYLQLSDKHSADHVHKAMEHVTRFKNYGNANLDNTTTLILILYELECSVRLGLPDVNLLVECIDGMQHVSLSTIDRVVDICLVGKDTLATQTAIRRSIDRHLLEPTPKWTHLSKLFIHLAKITSNFVQLFKSWSQYVDRFPEDEAAWMVCEAWNRGVTRDGAGITRELCTLALQVAQNLPSYKEVYEKHMANILGQDTACAQ